MAQVAISRRVNARVAGQLLRFVESDRAQNLTMTRHVDGLVEAYKDVGLVLVVADPAIFFGPGEARVNDSEAALMAVAWRANRRPWQFRVPLHAVCEGYVVDYGLDHTVVMSLRGFVTWYRLQCD